MFKEFKEFAMRGNVIDLAIGVIIGGAFGKIVTSLVNDIIMPPLGLLLGNMDFSDLKFVLKAAAENSPAVSLNYGVFVNNVVNFLIVAFCIFLAVRAINQLKKPQPAATATTKSCPECCSVIALAAHRCAFCTSVQK